MKYNVSFLPQRLKGSKVHEEYNKKGRYLVSLSVFESLWQFSVKGKTSLAKKTGNAFPRYLFVYFVKTTLFV